jgi:hypothetical protein
MNFQWSDEFPGSITVCDPDGIILYMNARSAQTFAADGGAALLGSNLFDCHPAAARRKLEELMLSRQKNVYSIEKNGVKKLIYQSPWYENGEYRGFVEMALEIPFEMPHFIRG